MKSEGYPITEIDYIIQWHFAQISIPDEVRVHSMTKIL